VTQHRKHRGYASQKIAADYMRAQGYAYCEPTGAGRPGTDLLGLLGQDVEVKARRGFDPSAAMRQQRERTSDDVLSWALLRLDGQGPASVEDWPVVIRLGVFVPQLLVPSQWGPR
jgi:hypothetical protein